MYAYFPPRTSNYFPGGPPYLSGLGDYAADLATYQKQVTAYKIDRLKWQQEKSIYDALVKKYQQKVAANDAAYAADLATYNKAYAAAKLLNVAASGKIATAWQLPLTPEYFRNGACLTQQYHDAYAKNCTTVKGLGHSGLGSNDPNCGMAHLPICNYPAPPLRSAYPDPKPPKALRAQPTAPVPPPPPTVTMAPPSTVTPPYAPPSSGGGAPTPPTIVPGTPSDIAPPADHKQASMVRNGLLLVAVIGGGYLVYRTIKKPKAA